MRKYHRLLIAIFSSTVLLSACGGGGGGGGGGGKADDIIQPSVSTLGPSDGEVGVPLNAAVVVTFSEAMDDTTLTTATFTLSNNPAVEGTVSYDPDTFTASFSPASTLETNTLYTATITSGVTDVAGNALDEEIVWQFTTGDSADSDPPLIISTNPKDEDVDVSIDSTIKATFSESMHPATLNLTTIIVSSNPIIDGTVSYNPNAQTMTFTPAMELDIDTVYSVIVTTGVTDLAGNSLIDEVGWSFTTGTEASASVPPSVVSTTPTEGATDTPMNPFISAVFSEDMGIATISPATFFLEDAALNLVSGGVRLELDNRTAVFFPDLPLEMNSTYTATITTGAQDQAGTPLAQDIQWSFTTGAVVNIDIVGPFDGCEVAYRPSVVTVKPGTTVKWTNTRDFNHTVTSSNATLANLDQCDEGGDPADTKELDSGVISTNGTFSHSFNTPGEFVYDCTISDHLMRGAVIVEP